MVCPLHPAAYPFRVRVRPRPFTTRPGCRALPEAGRALLPLLRESFFAGGFVVRTRGGPVSLAGLDLCKSDRGACARTFRGLVAGRALLPLLRESFFAGGLVVRTRGGPVSLAGLDLCNSDRGACARTFRGLVAGRALLPLLRESFFAGGLVVRTRGGPVSLSGLDLCKSDRGACARVPGLGRRTRLAALAA